MLHRSDTAALESVALFSAVPRRELRRLARYTETLILGFDVWLQLEGARVHEFFVVLEGDVAVTVDGDPVGYLLPGQWSDGAPILTGGPSPVGLVTATRARILSLGEREFVACLDTVPGLARRLLTASVRAA